MAEHGPELEERIRANSNPSEQIRAGTSAREILERILGDVDHDRIDLLSPRFSCDCATGRVLRAASLLGEEEIREIIATGEELEVRCSWCANVYRLTPDQLGATLHDA